MKKLFAFLVCAMMVLSVPVVAMAADKGAGNHPAGQHTVNLLEVGNWYLVNSDGTRQPMPRYALTDGMVLPVGSSIVTCDYKLPLSSAQKCIFDVTCSSKAPYGGGSVVDLRLFEGSSDSSVSNYIGPFYRADGDLVGQLIKTFDSGDHYFGIRNDGSEAMKITDLDVTYSR